MMYAVTTIGILLAMLLTMTRAFIGPTVFDRILAVNTFGTLTVLMIAVVGFLSGRPEFLDIALVYALINFIATIAVTKFVKFRGLGHPHLAEHTDDEGDI